MQHQNFQKKPVIRASVLAVLACTFCGSAAAAGMGRINVLSALGQPLRAEVEITATQEELATLTARLASPDAFARANIEYVGSLSSVHMSVERRTGNNAVVKISSEKPFSEPLVDMLVELNWTGGRLLREYTFLLNSTAAATTDTAKAPVVLPPVTAPQVSQSSTPAPKANVAASSTPSRQASAASVPAPVAAKPAPTPTPAPARTAASSDYTVKRGDTLSGIAHGLRTSEVSRDQMMAALYQANVDVFTNRNINRLREGKILAVPAASEAQRISPTEARQIILKASNFDAYRQSVASAARASQARTTQSTQEGVGAISPKVRENALDQTQPRDQLRISKTQVDATAAGTGGRGQAVAPEDAVARAKALQEANSRARDLEKNVADLQKLVDMKSQNTSDLQKQAAAAGTSPQAATQNPSVLSVETTAGQASEPNIDEVISSDEATDSDENFFTNPLSWGAILIALLGAGYVVFRDRRRRPQPLDLTPPVTDRPGDGRGAARGAADVAAPVVVGVTTAAGIPPVRPVSAAAYTADDSVDPVAEAEVYIAYGRDAQAEQILLAAIKGNPRRLPAYVKLLEIYAQRGSVEQFDAIAADLHAQTGGVGEQWDQAAEMGARVNPANPLYQDNQPQARGTSDDEWAAAAMTRALAAASMAGSAIKADSPDFVIDERIEEPPQAHVGDATSPVSGADDRSVPHAPSAEQQAEQAAQQTPLFAEDLENINYMGDLPNFDFGADDAKVGQSANERVSALSVTNVHGESNASALTGMLRAGTNGGPAPAPDEPDVDDEVGTKLELARAYEEMGDKEGARELLAEVISTGKASQKDQARSMLARIA